jgi:hypothetical protein
VVPDNVLFEGGAGETIRRKLLHECDVDTLLRLSSLRVQLRSKAQCTPSLALPFAGTKVHRTFVCFRLTPRACSTRRA